MGGQFKTFFKQNGRQAIDLFPDGDKPTFYSMGGLTISPARNYIRIQKWILEGHVLMKDFLQRKDSCRCQTFIF